MRVRPIILAAILVLVGIKAFNMTRSTRQPALAEPAPTPAPAMVDAAPTFEVPSLPDCDSFQEFEQVATHEDGGSDKRQDQIDAAASGESSDAEHYLVETDSAKLAVIEKEPVRAASTPLTRLVDGALAQPVKSGDSADKHAPVADGSDRTTAVSSAPVREQSAVRPVQSAAVQQPAPAAHPARAGKQTHPKQPARTDKDGGPVKRVRPVRATPPLKVARTGKTVGTGTKFLADRRRALSASRQPTRRSLSTRSGSRVRSVQDRHRAVSIRVDRLATPLASGDWVDVVSVSGGNGGGSAAAYGHTLLERVQVAAVQEIKSAVPYEPRSWSLTLIVPREDVAKIQDARTQGGMRIAHCDR